MKHETARGKVLYYSLRDGGRAEFGREWFSLTSHEDGQRTLRAQCEIEAGVVAPRDVLREVIYTTDSRYRPIDCYSRLHENGRFLGAGWMHFTGSEAQSETLSASAGRISQRLPLSAPARSLGAHPLSCDALHLPRYDLSAGPGIQAQRDVWMTSLEHDGCSVPLLARINLDIEYVGRERVEVPAGTFDAEHFRFLVAGSLPQEHPTEEIWCLPESYLFVKATVGGYMNASFELVEFEPRQRCVR